MSLGYCYDEPVDLRTKTLNKSVVLKFTKHTSFKYNKFVNGAFDKPRGMDSFDKKSVDALNYIQGE
jgi:hypothetical protein